MKQGFVFWRRATLGSYFLLIVLVATWMFVIAPPTSPIVAILSAVYLLVLFLPLRQLLANNPRVYMWSGYLILLYFTHAVVESYANDAHRILAIFELILSICYFVASTLCYRYSRSKPAH